MRVVKPGWINHEGKPIFSVDIHPDGSRCATGGQGDDYGKIVIWSMAPIREASLEVDENVPKILCQMDHHYACVNSVRWSHSGKFLASGGDDKLVMIWQTSRGAGPSTAFGSTGSVVLHEQWRPVYTLRGHAGDVLDLAWSPQDVWLATCSVDNTVVIWNALKFPEQVATLKGHTGLVKGVTWDPVGKYVASQSDDRTLRVWRTMDWQQESLIVDPFKECGGTTHCLRLSWSPDGHHIVSAHAMNNKGPTAQIIERQGFKARMDFVGHRKAVTVVRFNPNIFKKKFKGEKTSQYSCCAIGSKDRSLSIWLTALKRPLVVMHDLFENSILDLSWSPNGMELMSCSIDGTVAYMDFSTEEIGNPLSKDDVVNLLEDIYGKGTSLHLAATKGSQIIESTAMLNLQQQQKTQANEVVMLTPSKGNSNMSTKMSASGDNVPFKPTDKQIETRTADGRRRITPIFLAPQPEFGEVPVPFSINSNIGFHSSSEKSKIVVEKQNRVTAPGMLSPPSGSKSLPSPPQTVPPVSSAVRDLSAMCAKDSQAMKSANETTPEKLVNKQQTEKPPTTPDKPTPSEQCEKPPQPPAISDKQTERDKEKEKDKETVKEATIHKDKLKARLSSGSLSLKRKYAEDKRHGKRGRPSKTDQAAREAAMAAAAAEAVGSISRPDITAPQIAVTPGLATVALQKEARGVYTMPDLQLPALTIENSLSRVIQGQMGDANSLVVDVENNLELGMIKVHRLRCMRGAKVMWDHMLTSKISAVAGSNHTICAACLDGTVSVFSIGGRRLLPALVAGAPPAYFSCKGYYVLVVTTKGILYVWNCQSLKTEIRQESLATIMSGEPRFDVNVSTPAYIMDNETFVVKGFVLANQTSGRPCKGNASVTAFFLPREDIWNSTRGWEKPYRDALKNRNSLTSVPSEVPEYRDMKDISVKDYHLYFAYEYRFIDYYNDGHFEFEWTRAELLHIASLGGEQKTLVDSEVTFFVNVTDWYSGINRTGWASTIIYSNKVKMQWVGGNVRTFKPGSILKVQVAVSQYDGRPVHDGGSVTVVPAIANAQGQVNVYSNTAQTSPVIGGIAQFDVVLGIYAQRFLLTATYQDPTIAMSLNANFNPNFVSSVQPASIQLLGSKYYSPTNSFISVTTSTYHPQVNEYMIFHVTVSHFVPRIFFQIVSQSNIIDGYELEMTSRQKTFSIGLSRAMVPMARIVVYYIREPEEIVSDVMTFFVNGTHQNEVRLGINLGKDFTRNTVEFNAEADPGSYLAFSGMLVDLYNRGLNDGITENKLIDELMSYDEPANHSYKQLWRVGDSEYEYKFFHGYDYGTDTNTTFNSAGLIVLTDADVIRLPNANVCRSDADQFPCFSGIPSECYHAAQRCNGLFDGCPNDGADEWGCVYEETQVLHKSLLDRISRVMRYYDNSSWAWQEIFVKPDGRVDFRVDVPKYPLTWIINGVSISRDLGLGIMKHPVKYDVTRYMYIQVEHPTTILWGEQVGVRITVFNYWYNDDYIEVLITMHAGDNTQVVTVGEMGYVTSYAPNTHKGDHQTIVFLEPGESKDVYIPIVADKEYHENLVTFRVTATCFLERDEYVGTMNLKPNGVMNYYHTPYLIDLIRFPSIDIPQFKVNVPEYYRKQLVRENLYVPWSSVAMNTIFGDVVGPGFFEDYLNAENTIYRPYGSGEMVTFNFAYNLLMLKFMRSSNQLEFQETKVVLNELNVVLQRIFSYMNAEDGSFKMFRDDTKSNVWLTAFVGKTLAQAGVVGDWEQDLYIPQILVTKIVEFICSRQNVTTGAFDPDPDDLSYDRKLSSLRDMKDDLMVTHRVPLTAYVLIALTEMTDFIKGTSSCIERAKTNAADFLQKQMSFLSQDDIFFMAITAYALTLTTAQNDLVDKLWLLRRNDSDFTYFADQLVYENPSAIQNNVRYLMPRQELLNDAYAVQTTAYGLMAHIHAYASNDQTHTNQSLKVERDMTVSWLNTMRNSFAGFSSTQDTITAMEALYAYTLKDTNRNEFDMSVTVEATSTPNWQWVERLLKEDFTHLQRSYLPNKGVYGYVIPTAQGVGRAMLQLTVTSNVEYEHLMKTQQRYNNLPESDPIPFFDLQPQTFWSGRNDSIMQMRTCVSWLYTTRSLTSGLAVLEVDTPTGYVVMNDTLRDYVRSGVVRNLRRAEFYGNKVVFYFDYLDESRTCVNFRADRWYPVANVSRDHRIRVYDYYEPGMHRTTLYTVENLFRMSVCFVCGSYQCPYCPNFNTATLLRAGTGWGLLPILVIFMLRILLQHR